MDYATGKSADLGARYFDFGISNEQEGRILNEGLYRFKVSFGAGGVVHEFYEVELERGYA
jgi:lipid II:glycine glycyltransferase (peptidoglycan interpeptide bridge formation enzyme)